VKKIKWLSILLALVMLLTISGATLADTTSVDISDIEITGAGWVGTQVTASGTVTVVAEADSERAKHLNTASAFSFWGFDITSTDVSLSGGGHDADLDLLGWNEASANASFIFTWSKEFWLTDTCEYDISLFGRAITASFAWGHIRDGEYEDTGIVSKSTKVRGRAIPTWFNNGQFEVLIGTDMVTGYHFGLEMHEGVITDGRDMYGKYYDKTLEVVVSAGTKVTGSNRLQIGCDNNNVVQILTPTAGTTEFSQPVKVYWSTGSGNILISSISKIVDGVIQ